MKAPDKIYLGIQDLGSGYVYDLSLDNNGEQEYIRKDVLVEWLEDMKFMANSERAGAYQNVIDKLNEM